MKMRLLTIASIIHVILIFSIFSVAPTSAKGPGGGGKPGGETAGNNLSFPVIWAEGVKKILPGEPGMVPKLNGEWWYQWGTYGVDPDVTPASCPYDPDEINLDINPYGEHLCDNGIPDNVDLEHYIAGDPPADNPLPLVKAYIQKDPDNIWQAGSADWSSTMQPVEVDWIDWGDSLESVDWYTRSQVRIEVVLFQDIADVPMIEYEMRHTSGWGIDEVHGLATDLGGIVNEGPGTQATVYSHCARLTIQKLLVDRDDLDDYGIYWDVDAYEWKTEDVENTGEIFMRSIFNEAVYEAADGPGYYSAEINVKGRIIYGYTWNVRTLHDDTGDPLTAAGDYRITFSLDNTCGADVNLNTSLTSAQIIVPSEEELLTAALSIDTASTDEGGGTAIIDTYNNLTYIDVRIIERTGGKGGSKE